MTTPPHDPAGAPPAPRRTRAGAVIVGPTVRARYLPGLLAGLPLLAAVLSPFAAAGLQQMRFSRLRAGHDGLLEQLLAPAWAQLVLGGVLLWLLFALWGLVPLLFTRRVVLLDEERGELTLRRGVRRAGTAAVSDVEFAIGEALRGGMAVIALRGEGDAPQRQWLVPEIGWDAASFDGLRVLQAAAGLPPAPPRAVLVAQDREEHRLRTQRELAARLGMQWRAEYEHDGAAFQAEFDRVRRVLGGREEPREGDPRP